MQDDEACGRGLQRGGELIGEISLGSTARIPACSACDGRRGGGGFGEHDDRNFGCEVGVRERFDHGFGRFAPLHPTSSTSCLRVGEVAAKGVNGGGCCRQFSRFVP